MGPWENTVPALDCSQSSEGDRFTGKIKLQCDPFQGRGASLSVMSTLCKPVGCIARQAPLSMGFSRQEYWNGLPNPLGDLPHPGIKPVSPALQVDSLP